MYNQDSYERHGNWYARHFPTRESKTEYFRKVKLAGTDTVSQWLQSIFFNCLNPLLEEPAQSWLTVGDAYGFDAQYIAGKKNHVLASDLSSDFLEVASTEGIVGNYATENAEKLSFEDNRFDYVLCKESYHHFPRPYAALYEMLRVAKKGIVIIEPQDPITRMPLLLLLCNLFSSRTRILRRIWKNRFSFEPVGNFVYKVSGREFEKFAAGLNLPMIAFREINPNFYFKGAESLRTDSKSVHFLSIKLKKRALDLLVKFKIIPGQVLSAVIFKQLPDEHTMQQLKNNGYRLLAIPENPYN